MERNASGCKALCANARSPASECRRSGIPQAAVTQRRPSSQLISWCWRASKAAISASTTLAAERRSSMRLVVHEPMKTRSTTPARAACPAANPCSPGRAPCCPSWPVLRSVSGFAFGAHADDGRLLQQPPVRPIRQTFQTQGVMSNRTDAFDPSIGVRRLRVLAASRPKSLTLLCFAGEEGCMHP